MDYEKSSSERTVVGTAKVRLYMLCIMHVGYVSIEIVCNKINILLIRM